MKKLKLELEGLHVETFDTTEARKDQDGTVFANSLNPNCDHTPDGFCLATNDACLPWSQPPYCDKTYTCNTATDCIID